MASARRPNNPAGDPPSLPSGAGIERAARRGAGWSIALMLGRQPINLAATAFASRLLTADDYGLLAMAATSTALFQSFADMGLSWATIRDRELTKAQVDGLFWINVAAGLVLWGVVGAGGPALAAFYGRDELAAIAWALGASFALGGVAAQPAALLARSLRARAIFGVETAACLAGAATLVAGAAAGWGYWALAGQMLATQAVRTLLVLKAAGYVPSRPRRGAGIGRLVGLGGLVTAYGLVVYVGRNLDNILIGRAWGAAALGCYGRAYFLMSIPLMLATAGLSGVMIPTLAALSDDRSRMGRAYREALRATAALGLPIAGLLLVAAPEIVRLIYGDGWGGVVEPLRWLAAAGAVQTVTATCGWLYMTLGEGRRMLLVGVATTAVQAAALVVGNRYGVASVAAAYGLSTVALASPILWAAHAVASLPILPTLRAIRGPVVGTIAAAVAGLLAGRVAGTVATGPGALFSAKLAAGVLAYLAVGAIDRDDLAAFGLARGRIAPGALP